MTESWDKVGRTGRASVFLASLSVDREGLGGWSLYTAAVKSIVCSAAPVLGDTKPELEGCAPISASQSSPFHCQRLDLIELTLSRSSLYRIDPRIPSPSSPWTWGIPSSRLPLIGILNEMRLDSAGEGSKPCRTKGGVSGIRLSRWLVVADACCLLKCLMALRIYRYAAEYMKMIKAMLMNRGIQENNIRIHQGLAGK